MVDCLTHDSHDSAVLAFAPLDLWSMGYELIKSLATTVTSDLDNWTFTESTNLQNLSSSSELISY